MQRSCSTNAFTRPCLEQARASNSDNAGLCKHWKDNNEFGIKQVSCDHGLAVSLIHSNSLVTPVLARYNSCIPWQCLATSLMDASVTPVLARYNSCIPWQCLAT